jgi:hypothetical protein
MGKTVLAFDLYGTLLSTASVSKALAGHFGEDKANSIAVVWRKYQLEYTWRLNSMRGLSPVCSYWKIHADGDQDNGRHFPTLRKIRFVMHWPNTMSV